MAIDFTWSDSGGPLLVTPGSAVSPGAGSGAFNARVLTPPFQIGTASLSPQSDIFVTFKCRGKTNSGLGGWVRAKVLLKAGHQYITWYDPTSEGGRFTGLFYGSSVNATTCIMMSAEGGYAGSTGSPGGNAGFPNGVQGTNKFNSGGGGGGRTFGYLSGQGGYGGSGGGDSRLSSPPGTAGNLWIPGVGGRTTYGFDGDGGNGGFGYYGGGGGGGGWDYGDDYGGSFGGGGGGGSCYAGGLPSPTVDPRSPAEVSVTNATGGAESGGPLIQIVDIEPATFYDHSFATDGPLILTNESSTAEDIYTFNFLTNREISIYAWGQGTSNAVYGVNRGGYVRGSLNVSSSTLYVAALGAGRGFARPSTLQGGAGGYTGFFQNSISQSNALIIAAGAGSSGNNNAFSYVVPAGGAGAGGSFGVAGQPSTTAFSFSGGGGAGSLLSGGGGGSANGSSGTVGTSGTQGLALKGGNGGSVSNNLYGGGGGGGYYGGGGGAGGFDGPETSVGGGGGGGSNYVNTSVMFDYYIATSIGGEYISNPYNTIEAGSAYKGLLAISGEPISKLKLRVENIWRDVKKIYVKENDQWKQVISIYEKRSEEGWTLIG